VGEKEWKKPMCGLFGLIRNQACDPSLASDTFLALGSLAEERGTHAGGLAMALGGPAADRGDPAPGPRGAGAGVNSRADVTSGGWRVVKGHGAFGGVWRPSLRDPLDAAPAVLGHTRFATQGVVGHLSNASPLRVGGLIGTHNGDIDVSRLRDRFTLPEGEGHTDTEVLLMALDQAAGAIEPTLEVLSAAVGRTALVWTDRRRPRTVMLARTALSPLAVAFDAHGNLYWASNPGWFARTARHSGAPIPVGGVTPLTEGTLLVAEFADGRPRLTQRYGFTATARTLDEELAPRVAYLGFSHADKSADQKLLRHRTVADRARAEADAAPPELVP
jgi:glucosamine--fructose-6-phosphate aminotransferase (isomerizing)